MTTAKVLATVSTPQMPVTVDLNTASTIILHVTTPVSPLYISRCTLKSNSSESGVSGNVTPGSSSAPVNRTLQVNPTKFTAAHDLIASGASNLKLVITFDDSTFNATDFILSAS